MCKKSSPAGLKIKNQTVTGNGQQFADEINNQNRDIKTGVYAPEKFIGF